MNQDSSHRDVKEIHHPNKSGTMNQDLCNRNCMLDRCHKGLKWCHELQLKMKKDAKDIHTCSNGATNQNSKEKYDR